MCLSSYTGYIPAWGIELPTPVLKVLGPRRSAAMVLDRDVA